MALHTSAAPGLRARLGMRRAYLRALAGGLRCRRSFAYIQRLVLFVGYPRSGHSLVGSLLNAHRHAVVSHELNLLEYVRAGFGREQLYWLILEADRRFAARDRRWREFAYAVPDEWQGRFERLLVIGDKKGAGSTKMLEKDPWVLARLEAVSGADLRIVHVVRNPFDNVATMARRAGITLEEAARRYAHAVATNAAILADGRAAMTVRLESLVERPTAELQRLLDFVGLAHDEAYIDHCASIVFDRPHQSRNEASWPSAVRHELEALIPAQPFLNGYAFDGA